MLLLATAFLIVLAIIGFTDNNPLLAIIAAGIAIGLNLRQANKDGVKANKKFNDFIENIPDFKKTQLTFNSKTKCGLAIDEQSNKICLFNTNKEPPETLVVSYKDIISAEIIEDGDSITKTSRSSQLGSALVGGILLGGVGAIVGGLSGSTRTSQNVSNITLRIIINNTKKPAHDVSLLNNTITKKSSMYSEVMNNARHWHSLIVILIRKADEDDKEKSQSDLKKAISSSSTPLSLADELSKLAQLKTDGIISNEEFDNLKANLLNK